jgi:type I restriction enzyme M protein
MPSFGKRTPFGDSHLAPFETVYGDNADGISPRTQGEYSFGAEQIAVDKQAAVENENVDDKLLHSRWRCFSRDWIANTKGDSLDISWLKDKDSVDAADLPEPAVLAREAKDELSLAMSEIDALLAALEGAK